MTTEIEFCGETLCLDPLGAVFWKAQRALIVSDLHFEKGSFFAQKGVMLPPYDTRTTLRRISNLIERYKPDSVISLGDSFHDENAETRMEETDATHLESLTRETKWLWVLGNHDPAPPARFAGEAASDVVMGALTFRHEAKAGDVIGEISGHFHPCAKLNIEGRNLRRRCFASDGQRFIMPALGAYTGGLNILDAAFDGLLLSRNVFVMNGDNVFAFPQSALVADEIRHQRAG